MASILLIIIKQHINSPTIPVNERPTTVNKYFLSLKFFLKIILMIASKAALSASVGGVVVDENGQSISQSTVCLSSQSVAAGGTTPNCLQTQTTDAQGNYAFSQVDAGAYVVTIIDGRFPTYTWQPVVVGGKVSLKQSSDATTGFNFKRQFSFSNFQKPITISGSDLPELSSFNLSQDTVFLKVYAVDPANPTQQTVFFLGKVTDMNLKFAASAPWTVKEVRYEIFSPTAATQGSLFVQS
jgi:hypothetical protein